MKQYLIMCRSVTSAQRASRLLERSLIRAAVTKAPSHLTRSGCAYAVRLHAKVEQAVRLLRQNDISFGKIYATDDGNEYREESF